MMIKFFLGIAIIAFTSFCGYLLAKKYRQRKSFFMQFKTFNERYLSEVSYYRRPLFSFISQYSYKGEFSLLLKDFFENIKKEGNIMEEILTYQEYAFLKKEEKTLVVNYFQMLGKGDSASQKGYFSAVQEEIKKLEQIAGTECKKYGDLYVKLGFLFGLLVLILIV